MCKLFEVLRKSSLLTYNYYFILKNNYLMKKCIFHLKKGIFKLIKNKKINVLLVKFLFSFFPLLKKEKKKKIAVVSVESSHEFGDLLHAYLTVYAPMSQNCNNTEQSR